MILPPRLLQFSKDSHHSQPEFMQCTRIVIKNYSLHITTLLRTHLSVKCDKKCAKVPKMPDNSWGLSTEVEQRT